MMYMMITEQSSYPSFALSNGGAILIAIAKLLMNQAMA